MEPPVKPGRFTVEGDVVAIKGFVDACVISIAGANAGEGLGPDPVACEADLGTCAGDLNFCSTELAAAGSDLGTCEAELSICEADLLASGGQQRPASGQTISYGPGDDGDVEAGATLSYVDNGDGTVTDVNTGLMWEKKVGATSTKEYCYDESGSCANPHDADNAYPWTAGSYAFNGTIVTVFLEQLNNRCDEDPSVPCSSDDDCNPTPGGVCGFAGHRDWRIPNVKELYSLLDMGRPGSEPWINVAFDGANCGSACTDLADPACSCTTFDFDGGGLRSYWSSTTWQGNLGDEALLVQYGYQTVGFSARTSESKYAEYHARAVRGGL